MISLALLVLHVVFIAFVFFRMKNAESLESAVHNVLLIAILFAVGWAISAMLINQIFDPRGFGKHFDRDTITLALLTLGEAVFYKFYYKNLLIRK